MDKKTNPLKSVVETTLSNNSGERTITIKFQSISNTTPFKTNVSTFGELEEFITAKVPDVSNKIGDWSNLVLIDLKSRVRYDKLSEALLPNEDCIFLVAKTKEPFGSFKSLDEFTTLKFGEKRNYLRELGVAPAGSNPSNSDLTNAYVAFLSKNKTSAKKPRTIVVATPIVASSNPKKLVTPVKSSTTAKIAVNLPEDINKIHASVVKRIKS